MSASPPVPNPWREYQLAEGDPTSVRIGPLRVDLRREQGEIWIAWSRSTGRGTSEAPTEWRRWAAPGADHSVTIRPALPERALVVEPEIPFSVAPHSKVRIYVRVPLIAKVLLSDRAQTVLQEIPTVVMSNTWWGDFVGGELCFFLPTRARRVVEPHHFQPHLVVCPVLIDNSSEDVLEVVKSVVRVAHVSIFDADGRLWADETRVRYLGDEDGSEIRMSGAPPPEAPDAVLLAPPRAPIPRGLRAKTFARLKFISGI